MWVSENYINFFDVISFFLFGIIFIVNIFIVFFFNSSSKFDYLYMDYDLVLEMDSDEEFDGFNGL